MKRRFNITGLCDPQRHYMVKLDDRLKKIREEYVDEGSYFVINRGRQYGKTTTLRALEDYLDEDYLVLSLDFQGIGTADFANEAVFVRAFAISIMEAFSFIGIGSGEEFIQPLAELTEKSKSWTLIELFVRLSRMCADAPKPIVLMIDEVDSASNNQVFIDFLAQLRRYYLKRDKTLIFHSVILAGVYDIKNLKLKLRPESEHQYNSPWNIAAKFDVKMSFSAKQIAGMLEEYEADKHTGMDISEIAEEIYQYTSGYPVLVSFICKFLDEELCGFEGYKDLTSVWTKAGITEAVKNLLSKSLPLFESMVRQLDEYPDVKQMLNAILFQGKRVTFNPDNAMIQLAAMFGYIVNKGGSIQVANRIFETRLYNLFLSEEELTDVLYGEAQGNRDRFIKGGKLNMELVLEKFVLHYTDIYGDNDEKFVEAYGRKFFLLYLKPIINGTGNYYIEAQTRDARRTDVIVDYLGEQFIVELKIWRGDEYNERGEEQLTDYLDYYHKDKGYMLSFNFNKKKEVGVQELRIGGKTIIEAVV